MSNSYVIATSREWNNSMARSVSEKTGADCHLITKKSELTLETLSEIGPRIIFFPHWSYMIPAEVFQSYACIVFHMTDLPYGRGGSPLQNLIIRGMESTRISALKVVSELDAGPIYMKEDLSLSGTAEEIFLRASGIIEGMILSLIAHCPEPFPQSGEPVLFKRRRPDESNLADFHPQDLKGIYDFIRMLDAPGYPRAFLDLGDFRISFEKPHITGTGIEGRFVVTRKSQKSDLE